MRRFWKNKSVMMLFAGLIVGAMANWILQTKADRGADVIAPIQIRVDSPLYKFINPLLFSDTPKSSQADFVELENRLDDYATLAKKDPTVQSVSVYFRYLNNAQWTGIDENELYAPSSMLKVLAMLAALKLAEQNPAILSEKLEFHRSDNKDTYYKPDDSLTDGFYTLEQLISVMIKNSDNDAYYAIVSDPHINNEFTQIYTLFHLPTPSGLNATSTDFMSPKAYAALYRILYNSTFFQWDLSEQVLELLSKTTFTHGLVAGLPENVPVAHKFGENTDELHDCGIVYYPNHPFLLCVMTKGTDLSKLEGVISGISKLIYDYISATPSMH